MNQLPLPSILPPHTQKPLRMVRSAYLDRRELLSDLMWLYLSGQPFDVDCTYNPDMWERLPQPVTKTKNYKKIPVPTGSIDSVFYNQAAVCIGYDLRQWGIYIQAAILELYRILKPGGKAIVNCSDMTSTPQYLTHVWLIDIADVAGFSLKDLIILIDDELYLEQMFVDQDCDHQTVAKKIHSYFMVFEKRNQTINNK